MQARPDEQTREDSVRQATPTLAGVTLTIVLYAVVSVTACSSDADPGAVGDPSAPWYTMPAPAAAPRSTMTAVTDEENGSAKRDVQRIADAIDRFAASNGNTYPADVIGVPGRNVTLALPSGGTPETISVASGNTIFYRNRGTYYVVCGQHGETGIIFVFNSASRGPVTVSGHVTLAACVAGTGYTG